MNRLIAAFSLLMMSMPVFALDPLLSVPNVSVGYEAKGFAEVKLSLNNRNGDGPASVTVETLVDGADENDFTYKKEPFTWEPGEAGTKIFRVDITQDGRIKEVAEGILLGFSDIVGLRHTTHPRRISIRNDPKAVPDENSTPDVVDPPIVVDANCRALVRTKGQRAHVYEGPDADAYVTYQLDRPADCDIELRIRTKDRVTNAHGATAFLDYVPVDRILRWSKGDRFSQTIIVDIIDDNYTESPDEFIELRHDVIGARMPLHCPYENVNCPGQAAGHSYHTIVIFPPTDGSDTEVEPPVAEQLAALNGGVVEDDPIDEPADDPIDEPVAPPVDNSGFKVFDATLYLDPVNIGERTAVAYEGSLGLAPGSQAAPTSAGVSNAVQSILNQESEGRGTGTLSIMDVERYLVWPFATGDAHAASIDIYAGIMEQFSNELSSDTCMYGMAPQAGINHANFSINQPAVRSAWTEHSNVTRDVLVPHVDALCPTIYTFYEDNGSGNQIEYWRNFAIETIKEARRIAPEKPVYPFIWPQFHAGGGVQGFPFIPDAYWRVIIETMKEHADGVVIWGGWDFDNGGQLPWDESASWVAITREVFELN